ncbi:hypothetical protein ACFV0T_28930 [Streptomyces sp. NPDC059582]|uniref:hypothetical protein n=1 Tax=Streptomyces sp. NPDC059582 TaxID=3346875 RepID=UPI0036C510F8
MTVAGPWSGHRRPAPVGAPPVPVAAVVDEDRGRPAEAVELIHEINPGAIAIPDRRRRNRTGPEAE